jgi:hypothetical protein
VRVFENRVLRKKFGHKREKVAGGWRKLHNEELHNLYASQYIIRMIKSRLQHWLAGHAARIGWMRNAYKILVEKPERRGHLGDLGVHGWIILKWIVKNFINLSCILCFGTATVMPYNNISMYNYSTFGAGTGSKMTHSMRIRILQKLGVSWARLAQSRARWWTQ